MKENEEQIISCNEMISKVFSNIEISKYEEKDNISNIWNKILISIDRNKEDEKEKIGNKLFFHSSLVDIKNEILLIETDHPGFIQLFRIYEKYILNGLKRFVPQLNIKSLSFRLKGSKATLINKEKYYKENELYYLEKKFKKEDEYLNKNYKNEKTIKNKKIPIEIEDVFKRMRKIVLTKDKK